MLQENIQTGKLELAWSYILDYENGENPFDERQRAIAKWQSYSVVDIEENDVLLSKANALTLLGFAPKDALHIACAIMASCEYFVTTDDFILKRATEERAVNEHAAVKFDNFR